MADNLKNISTPTRGFHVWNNLGWLTRGLSNIFGGTPPTGVNGVACIQINVIDEIEISSSASIFIPISCSVSDLVEITVTEGAKCS